MPLFRNPTDKDYEARVAENAFVTDIQLAVERALRSKGMSQAKLARILGVSEARVSQMLGGNGSNLQARTIARIAHALGLTARFELLGPNDAWSRSDGRQRDVSDLREWVRMALHFLDENKKHEADRTGSIKVQRSGGSFVTNDNYASWSEEKLVA